jgi:hypothetical protein
MPTPDFLDHARIARRLRTWETGRLIRIAALRLFRLLRTRRGLPQDYGRFVATRRSGVVLSTQPTLS